MENEKSIELEKETFIKIQMVDIGEDVELEYHASGSYEDIIYLWCEIANKLKKNMVSSGLPESIAKQLLVSSVENSLDTFK